MFLVITFLGASERLHNQFHADDAEHRHSSCAVCALIQGQVDVPAADVSEIVRTLSVAWTLPSDSNFVLVSSDLSVASSRGPPVSVSSQS